MKPGLSIHLDFLRLSAALTVFAAHALHAHFEGLDVDLRTEFDYGADAVILFFALSGFVIAHAGAKADADGRRFVFNRVTRLVSVVTPAVALTVVADAAGERLAPSLYADWRGSTPDGPIGFVSALFMVNEWSPFGVHAGSNHPLWSVSYEFAYYLAFAAATFLDGWRRWVVLAAVAVAAGAAVLLLAPAWLLGVVAYRVLQAAPAEEGPARRGVWFAAALAGPAVYFSLNADEVDLFLLRLSFEALGEHPGILFRYSQEALWHLFVGAAAATHLYFIGRAIGPGRPPAPAVCGAIRWAAGASFSLYAAHYPILMLANAALWDAAPGPVRAVAAACVALVLCLVFASLFERPLPAFRRRIAPLFGLGPAQARAA
ncbi:MAG: acyltransferase family protein [Pseudomonadota bacterium]